MVINRTCWLNESCLSFPFNLQFYLFIRCVCILWAVRSILIDVMPISVYWFDDACFVCDKNGERWNLIKYILIMHLMAFVDYYFQFDFRYAARKLHMNMEWKRD